MKNFIIFNNLTGDIIRQGHCPDCDFDLQVINDNEAIIEGTADAYRQMINPKEVIIIDKTEEVCLDEAIKDNSEKDRAKGEQIIHSKMAELLRDMAIAELTKEGKIK
jgi:hypothetical protein